MACFRAKVLFAQVPRQTGPRASPRQITCGILPGKDARTRQTFCVLPLALVVCLCVSSGLMYTQTIARSRAFYLRCASIRKRPASRSVGNALLVDKGVVFPHVSRARETS